MSQLYASRSEAIHRLSQSTSVLVGAIITVMNFATLTGCRTSYIPLRQSAPFPPCHSALTAGPAFYIATAENLPRRWLIPCSHSRYFLVYRPYITTLRFGIMPSSQPRASCASNLPCFPKLSQPIKINDQYFYCKKVTRFQEFQGRSRLAHYCKIQVDEAKHSHVCYLYPVMPRLDKMDLWREVPNAVRTGQLGTMLPSNAAWRCIGKQVNIEELGADGTNG
jgi:hypothetical protein